MNARDVLADLVKRFNADAGNSPYTISGLAVLLDAYRAEVVAEHGPFPMPTGTGPSPTAVGAALVRLRQYGERTSTWSTATYGSGAEKALHETALTLAAEVDRLRARVAELEGLTQQSRTEAIADVGDWFEEIGEKNTAYLVRTHDIPAARDMRTVSVEDPHDSPLHRTYETGHDLPPVTS
ncbi:hypothetical protein ACFYNN_13070 [Streptomyces sp. NPDC006978]|uniref:hypothetical protein n=1 Tax=Streptomyces sp. NPDC006978 TaxID=3364769 RepID=UPI0036B68AEF